MPAVVVFRQSTRMRPEGILVLCVQETAWEVPAAVVAARGGGTKVWGPAASPSDITRPPCPLSCFALLPSRSVRGLCSPQWILRMFF